MVEKPVENAHTEAQAVDWDAFVDSVEHSGKVQIRGQSQRGEPEAANAEPAKDLASVPPNMVYGTTRPSGSPASRAAVMAS